MSLVPGTRLGPYQIEVAIGAGGMGEVYRARDARLGRDVAVKVLPEAFAQDADRLARFEREAKAIAALSHPNILAIFDTGTDNGHPFVVTELLDGKSLRDQQTALPVRKAIEVAVQIARGLVAAHGKDIVHRDLKPENIFLLHDGQVKILDFGLARQASSNSGRTETVSVITDPGVVMGTVGYMAPEQVRGQAVDARADLFALGAILYEMLSGQRAFKRETAADTMSAILTADPPELTGSRAEVSPALDRIVRHCLEKNPAERFQTARDIVFALDGITGSTGQALVPPPTTARVPRFRTLATLTVAAAVFAAIGFGAAWWIKPAAQPPRRVVRFAQLLPEDARWPMGTNPLAISPDGSQIAYVTADGQVSVRRLDEPAVRTVSGISGKASHIVFSPDGQWILYRQPNGETGLGIALRKIAVDGGVPVTVYQRRNGGAGFSFAWSGNKILVSNPDTGIQSVSDSGGGGGDPQPLTPFDDGTQVADMQLLDDGDHLLYSTHNTVTSWRDANIVLRSLRTGAQQVLVRAATNAHLASGYLVFSRDTAIFAQPFDAASLKLTGEARPVLDGVRATAGGRGLWVIADEGTLAYVAGGDSSPQTLVWVDRQGHEMAINAPARRYQFPRLSPDGTTVLVKITETDRDVWRFDLKAETLSLVTSGGAAEAWFPIWTPDGSQVVFGSQKPGDISGIFRRAADGTGDQIAVSPPRLASGSPQAVSRDGKWLVYRMGPPPFRLWIQPLDGSQDPRPLLQSQFDQFNARISPDDRWIAYQSNETGRYEVYVRPFPDVDQRRWPVSSAGGQSPVWSRDGRELVFLSGTTIESVSLHGSAGAIFSFDKPQAWFDAGRYVLPGAEFFYDISADGTRLLFIKPAQAAARLSVNIVTNWIEEIRAQARPPVR